MKKPLEIGDNLAFVLIILIIMVICLIGGYLDSKAQTVALPTWVADSLIYETTKGRQCSLVLEAQQNEIQALGLELIATGNALELSQNESKTLSALVTNAKESNEILTMQFQKDIKQEKRNTRKWKGLAILEAVGFIGLLLLL